MPTIPHPKPFPLDASGLCLGDLFSRTEGQLLPWHYQICHKNTGYQPLGLTFVCMKLDPPLPCSLA